MQEVNTALIQSRMAEKKITLQEMAELLGYKNASSFFKYLKGDFKFKAHHVPILLEKLDLTMNELFYEQKFAKTANIH